MPASNLRCAPAAAVALALLASMTSNASAPPPIPPASTQRHGAITGARSACFGGTGHAAVPTASASANKAKTSAPRRNPGDDNRNGKRHSDISRGGAPYLQ
ncbi:MAG: hypothetical protein LBK99_02045, partial [Opitutaceae bacterium]|nr:hypothetical protein [Opitutaceae bacterium]